MPTLVCLMLICLLPVALQVLFLFIICWFDPLKLQVCLLVCVLFGFLFVPLFGWCLVSCVGQSICLLPILVCCFAWSRAFATEIVIILRKWFCGKAHSWMTMSSQQWLTRTAIWTYHVMTWYGLGSISKISKRKLLVNFGSRIFWSNNWVWHLVTESPADAD